ncbi:short-chain dehydrogenase [Photobacterium gaetbulicola]|uniref:Short chain dehydrogenase/reductase family oxidoreductase n=1 Tax=Photobacterium gaetbulicola Gung47 TaxID=658445 RepID=A0A0C5WAT3_9GAMM|nr:SDR family oxidoreductase [Photobacterium gaetbulicola]AJR08691.1 short chain dehydrogenase/reductase family oxidoreductase [Photobacterium gaetbulicola Gung47]PSU10324.1 short-chain dehydrogenase [Photobacterium gaetbulicola]
MENRVVLVTGGANGIGKGIANYLAKKMLVIAADIDENAGFQLVSENPLVRFKQLDVTSEQQISSLIDEIKYQHGRLDAVVNNAAIANPYNAPLHQLDVYDWNKALAVNLTAPMLMAKHTVSLLRDTKGCIVNIASTRAIQSESNTEAYSASKGGIVALTHSLAVSVGPDVRVNCISPGWIHTTDELLRDIDHQQHLVGRVGQVQDIASMVGYLISEEAGFITGQNFVIDGGMTKKMIYSE